MENKKEYCEKLIEKWREINRKWVSLKDNLDFPHSPEDYKEFDDTKEKLKDECLEFLSPKEKFEIEK